MHRAIREHFPDLESKTSDGENPEEKLITVQYIDRKSNKQGKNSNVLTQGWLSCKRMTCLYRIGQGYNVHCAQNVRKRLEAPRDGAMCSVVEACPIVQGRIFHSLLSIIEKSAIIISLSL